MLNKARESINDIDSKMIELFKQRMIAVKSVLIYKKENNIKVLDKTREQELILKNVEILNDKDLEDYYKIFLNGMLEASKKFQEDNYE